MAKKEKLKVLVMKKKIKALAKEKIELKKKRAELVAELIRCHGA